MKRPPSCTQSVSSCKRQKVGEGFWDYASQVAKKHNQKSNTGLNPIIASHSFPPTDLQEETNVKFAQKVLCAVAAGDRSWQLLLIMLFQAPDHCWCFHAIMDPLIRGVLAQQAGKFKFAKSHFDQVQRILQKRADRTMVFGNGEVGIYNAEHLTATMKGKTHVQALRIKLEKWPAWIDGVISPLLSAWPASNDVRAISALLQQPRFARKLPEGIHTKLRVNKNKVAPIVDLFGGDSKKAYSVLSQALLFAEIMKPSDKCQLKLRRTKGWGAGPFVVRGLWMDVQKDRNVLKNFPQLDSETFCPGFTGALGGASACNLEKSTGISLNPGSSSAPNWSSWEVQVRFTAWMHALQVAQPKGSGPKLHSTELEACLCFFLRYKVMKTHAPGSREYVAASNAIGSNIAPAAMKKIFAKSAIVKARKLLASRRRRN